MKTALDRRYQAVYTAEAAAYDRRSFGNRRGDYARRVKNEVILEALSDLGPDARVLDMATGTGRIAHDLLWTFDRVWAADLTRGMLREAARPRLQLVQADMKRLALKDASFDAITLGSFLYLVPERDYPDFSADLFRVLKPGGRLVCEVANPLTLFSPLSLARIGRHKWIRRRDVKSFVPAWRLRRAFPRFTLESIHGVEYPLVGKSFGFYRFTSRLLGRLPLLRGCGGKYIAVLKKPC